MPRTTLKQGDLQRALVDTAMAMIAEKGFEALSVSELTRRLGVSGSAPYRHFPRRHDLLAAAAAQSARELADQMQRAVEDVHRRSDADQCVADALAATAVVYAVFVAQRRAGFEFIFADELTRLERDELVQARRAVIDVLLPLTMSLTHDPRDALRLMHHHIAAAHGLGALFSTGFVGYDVDDLAALKIEATLVTHTLLSAARTTVNL